MTALPDEAARLRALTDHGATLLVEAGAGSGKTALMAGRVVLMLAAGVAPRSIAAITFTELAAGQLFTRVSEFLDRLLAGEVPPELRLALPDALDPARRANLEAARAAIAELTVTTIHGFARVLTRPYPVEAGMDPGARVMDEAEARLAARDLLKEFLRGALDGTRPGSPLAAFVLAKGAGAQAPVQRLAEQLLQRPSVRAASAAFDFGTVGRLRASVDRFVTWLNATGLEEPTTAKLAGELRGLAESYGPLVAGGDDDWRECMRFALEPPTCAAHTDKYGWRAWGRKGKWATAAAKHGRSKAESERLSAEGEAHYRQVGEAWRELHGSLDAAAFAALADDFRPLIARYAAYKRDAALLDFEDLLGSARRLLGGHEDVRRALAGRYAHVLVDEFQDTDPVQAEILWRLCGEGPADAPWRERALRAGALFCVGDPKQAIYRFRGADVDTYVAAREAIRRRFPGNVLEVTTNFRSVRPVLGWVNTRFRAPLSADGQPGFQDLMAVREAGDGAPRVLRLDFEVTAGLAAGKADDLRESEARAVAALCRRLVGNYLVVDRDGPRPARPGDIALLAPTGTQLWRYERALEEQGIPVASQAGKGFYRRQEVQDLIAVTRVLADARDTVAFGALMRGPLVGLTEEELLDIVAALPEDPSRPGELPRFRPRTPPELVAHPVARDALARLQALARRAGSTTPFDLLAEAVEELRVRPLIRLRHPGGAERALANVDLYLELARPYGGRGLSVFARDMRARWEDAEAQMEGRPDAEQQAVQLITMHSAKGLEWPIVVPVNTGARSRSDHGILHDRGRDELHHYVGPVRGKGYEDCEEEEDRQTEREHQRLLYVACTRAAELLLLPRPAEGRQPWLELVDLGLAELPAADFTRLAEAPLPAAADEGNRQDAGLFGAEAARVAAETRRIEWHRPSRHEGPPGDEPEEGGEPQAWVEEPGEAAVVRGGPVRGRVVHKLIEEILTGEAVEEHPALEARAGELLRQLGAAPAGDPADGPCPAEIAATAMRALALPEVAAVRERLLPELAVHGYEAGAGDAADVATTGVADAVVPGGLVIDWKSDVEPAEATRAGYRAQVKAYLELLGVPAGCIAWVSAGRVEPVGR